MAPEGIIPVAELPEGWGLLEVSGSTVKTTKKLNVFFLDERIASAEVPMLVAALRRTQIRSSSRRKRR